MGNNFRKNTPQPNTTNSKREAFEQFFEWYKKYVHPHIDALEKGEKELKEKIAILEKKLADCQCNVTMEKEAPVVIPSSSEKEALTTEENVDDNTREKEESVTRKEVEKTPQMEQDNTPQKEPEEHSDWIYFSTQEKGVFQLSKQKRSSDNNVCFKINTATLEIEYIHSQYDSRALSYRNEWLLPVCEIINNIANASSIKMEQSGKVIKQGDDFVIDVNNKIKIRLL